MAWWRSLQKDNGYEGMVISKNNAQDYWVNKEYKHIADTYCDEWEDDRTWGISWNKTKDAGNATKKGNATAVANATAAAPAAGAAAAPVAAPVATPAAPAAVVAPELVG